MSPTSGNTGTVDGTACSAESSSSFTPTLTTTSNAFCGTGSDHTPVTYTSTPTDDEDRIREVVGTHCAGSCTQTVSPIIRYSPNNLQYLYSVIIQISVTLVFNLKSIVTPK